MPKKPSIATIAEKVGVSPGVVSAVLNKKENEKIFVSREKKQKILDTVEELDYVRPKGARELASGKSDTIGVIFHRLTPFFSMLVEELQMAAFKKGLEITPYITEGEAGLEEHFLEQCRDGRVDGIITVAHIGGSTERYRNFSKKYSMKILAYGPPIDGQPTIHFDEQQCGRAAYLHLKDKGCKRLASLGGIESDGRITSFHHCAGQGGYDSIAYTGGHWTGYFEESRRLAGQFISAYQPFPDGVFCYSDTVASALLRELREHGIRAGHDVAIVSCDNTQICEHTYPSLTSVDINVQGTALSAIDRLEDLINGESPYPLHTEIPVSLQERESTLWFNQ